MISRNTQHKYFFPLSVFYCVGGLFFGFANPVLHFPPLIFLFFLGLNLISLNSDSAGHAFARTWLASGLAFSASFYWVVIPVNVYGGFPLFLAVFCPLLLGFYIGIYSALYAVFIYKIKNSFSWIWLGIFGGCAWAGLEFFREYILTGIPWFMAAQSFAVWPESIQSVSVVGSYGLAMILASCGIWLSLGKVRAVLCAAVVLLLVLGYGFVLPGQENGETEVDILAVQGNIDQDLKWEQPVQLLTIQKYMNLTLKGVGDNKPDLVVWPETALPFYFQESTEVAGKVRDFVRENSLDLITGSPAYQMDEDGVGYKLYNRAYWISENGFIHDYYDKERLVPFGEYVPFGRYIPFVNKLVQGELDFSSGTVKSPLIKGDLALGVLICYEIIFPGLVLNRVEQGANIILNISNDAWFGNTSAPVQHLHLSVLRAVELNRYIVRATNTGLSAFIDPEGNVYHQSNLFEDINIRGRAGLVEKNSIYYYIHQAVIYLLLAGAVTALSLHTYKKRKFST
ncbi:MAG: apolipoprotein N-acyltransferase [Desulfonatronovibrio sp.]